MKIPAGTTIWVPAQQHQGENTGETPSHSIFVELKEGAGNRSDAGRLGPG